MHKYELLLVRVLILMCIGWKNIYFVLFIYFSFGYVDEYVVSVCACITIHLLIQVYNSPPVTGQCKSFLLTFLALRSLYTSSD